MRRSMRRFCLGCLLASVIGSPAFAGDACSEFKWDASAERALFVGEAKALAAGGSVESAPLIETGQLYRLALKAQSGIAFAAPPSKKMLADGASAGLVRFRTGAAGAYRISVDRGFWIDVVAAGEPLPSSDFSGAPGCGAPRKIVLYQLPANAELLLQLSAAPDAQVKVAVTAVR